MESIRHFLGSFRWFRSKKGIFFITKPNKVSPSPLNVCSIDSVSFSLIMIMRQCSIERREIIVVDKPDARKHLDFNF